MAMTAKEFTDIQRAAGMSDRRISDALGYMNPVNGRRRVRRFRLGAKAIPESVEAVMRSIGRQPPPFLPESPR